MHSPCASKYFKLFQYFTCTSRTMRRIGTRQITDTPWSGHCKQSKAEFTLAASKYSDGPQVALAGVDCTRQNSLCSASDVRGYPTIKYFSYLKMVTPYECGRSEEDVVNYLVKLGATVSAPVEANDPKVTVFTDDNFDSLVTRKRHTLLFFYTNWCKHCKPAKTEYIEAAKRLQDDDVQFGLVDAESNIDTADRFSINGFPTVLRFTEGNLDGEFKGERTVEAFISFARGDADQNLTDEL